MKSCVVVLVALSITAGLSSGCSLERSPIPSLRDSGIGGDPDVGASDVPEGLDGGMDAGIDTGMIDTGMIDAGIDTGRDTGVDTGIDTGMPDTGVDAGMPDTGVDAGMPDTGVDAGMPDTGVDAGPARPSCTDLFGGLESYMACGSTGISCEFYVDRADQNEVCNAICATVTGSTCTAAYRTDGDCTRGGTEACGSSGGDRICICSRP